MNNSLIEKISLWQLFILILLFELGSALVINIAGEAKQDAWIVSIVASLVGIGMISFYHALLNQLPGKNLFEILTFCLGSWIGKAFSLIYILYFFYLASFVLRDFGELLISTVFTNTPLEVISMTLFVAIMYVTYLGLEVMARSSEIFISYIIPFIIFIGIGIWITGELKFSNIQPILGDGYQSILQSTFKMIHFPYTEIIVFLIIIPHVSKFHLSRKTSIVAIIASGILLTYSIFIQIATLGADMRARSNFPLLSAAREISLLNFIERIDLLIVFIMMFTILVKVFILFFSSLKGLEHIFNLPYRVFVFPVGTLIPFFSILIGKNFAEYTKEGQLIISTYIQFPLHFLVPLFIFPILIWKVKKGVKS